MKDAGPGLLAEVAGRFSEETGLSVAFCGYVRDDEVSVSVVHGARRRSLDGLRVQRGRGLGGRALAERRPRLAGDYRTARTITHDYDDAVLGEGISTLLATPVIVAGEVLAVIWGGVHADDRPAALRLDRAAGVANWFGERLALEAPAPRMPVAVSEELRSVGSDLGRLVAGVEDPQLRDRLAQLHRRLVALEAPAASDDAPHLSRRELDTLREVALGRTNQQIADRLGLKESTVKSYLVTAMSKLDAPTRYAAVAAARRAGIIA